MSNISKDPEKLSKADYLFKVVIVGEKNVGKITLIKQVIYDFYEDYHFATIGASIYPKNIEFDNHIIKLVIWVLAPQEDFHQTRKAYYQNTAGAILIFDRTRPETIERFVSWRNDILGVCGKIPIVLVENKTDLPRKISRRRIQNLSKKLDAVHVPISAKTGATVDEPFEYLTREILKRALAKYP